MRGAHLFGRVLKVGSAVLVDAFIPPGRNGLPEEEVVLLGEFFRFGEFLENGPGRAAAGERNFEARLREERHPAFFEFFGICILAHGSKRQELRKDARRCNAERKVFDCFPFQFTI